MSEGVEGMLWMMRVPQSVPASADDLGRIDTVDGWGDILYRKRCFSPAVSFPGRLPWGRARALQGTLLVLNERGLNGAGQPYLGSDFGTTCCLLNLSFKYQMGLPAGLH